MTFVDELLATAGANVNPRTGKVSAKVMDPVLDAIRGMTSGPLEFPADLEGQRRCMRVMWNVCGERKEEDKKTSYSPEDIEAYLKQSTFEKTIMVIGGSLAALRNTLGTHVSAFPDVNSSTGALLAEPGYPRSDDRHVVSGNAYTPYGITFARDSRASTAARVLSRKYRYPDGRVVSGFDEFRTAGLPYQMALAVSQDMTDEISYIIASAIDKGLANRKLSVLETTVLIPDGSGGYVQITPTTHIGMLGAVAGATSWKEERRVNSSFINWAGGNPQNAAVIASKTRGRISLLDGFPDRIRKTSLTQKRIVRDGTLLVELDRKSMKAIADLASPRTINNIDVRDGLYNRTFRQIEHMTRLFGRSDLGLTEQALDNLNEAERQVHLEGYGNVSAEIRARFVERIASRIGAFEGINTESAIARRRIFETIAAVMRNRGEAKRKVASR